jgi:predicted peptidase
MKTTTMILFACCLLAGNAWAQLPLLPGMASPDAPVPDPEAPMYRQTGEQYRVYEFPNTAESIPYRLYVPETWTPDQQLPVLITLRAGTSVNNNHRAPNSLVTEARERGYIVISPLGYRGFRQPYYGSRYPVIRPNGPSVPADGWTEEEDQRAHDDVMYVLGLVAAEYNADMSRVFIHGQNPSGSAALHFVEQYPDLFKGAIISSAPIVTDDYPFETIRGKVALFILHGDQDRNNPIEASRQMAATFQANGVETSYVEVPGGEHLTAYMLIPDQIYDFMDAH